MQSDRFAQMPQHGVLSLFFTAGFPRRDDMMPILEQLQAVRVDMVEVGFPFSDPVADGPPVPATAGHRRFRPALRCRQSLRRACGCLRGPAVGNRRGRVAWQTGDLAQEVAAV